MNSAYKDLGKVRPTPEGAWTKNKEYSIISIVNDPLTNLTYISKKDVPKGININNKEYWQKITSAGFKDNNIIILTDTDDTDNLIKYTLPSAINSISVEDRRPGMILGFYGDSYDGQIKITDSWYLYQYNFKDISNWTNTSYWSSIYNNVNKFKGYFVNKDKLIDSYPLPAAGDYAYVGNTLKDSVVYRCITNSFWNNSEEKFIEIAKTIYDEDINKYKKLTESLNERIISLENRIFTLENR